MNKSDFDQIKQIIDKSGDFQKEQLKKYIDQRLTSEINSFKELAKQSFQIVFDRLDQIEVRLDSLETKVTAIETRLESVENRLTKIETRLMRIEDDLSILKDLAISNQVKLNTHERRLQNLAVSQA